MSLNFKTLVKTAFFCAFLGFSGCNAEDLQATQNPATSDPESNLIAQSCDLNFSRSGLCASLSFDATPNSEQENPFTLKFFSASEGNAVSGPFIDPSQTVSVKLWMPSMGHGSSPVTVSRISTGIYRASSVYFVMPGDWEIRVLLKAGTTVADQSSLFLDHVE